MGPKARLVDFLLQRQWGADRTGVLDDLALRLPAVEHSQPLQRQVIVRHWLQPPGGPVTWSVVTDDDLVLARLAVAQDEGRLAQTRLVALALCQVPLLFWPAVDGDEQLATNAIEVPAPLQEEVARLRGHKCELLLVDSLQKRLAHLALTEDGTAADDLLDRPRCLILRAPGRVFLSGLQVEEH